MANEKPKQSDNPIDAFSSAAQPSSLKSFSDELLTKFKGKVLEFYIGDQAENISWEEYSIPMNSVIIGKLIEVLDRFITIQCYYIDKSGKTKSDLIVYINAFQIRAMSELDGNGSLNDVFLGCKNAEKIRKAIKAHGK
jgi:hypothetical protein